MALEYWSGTGWETVAQYDELGGGAWEMRPQPFGTMWRISLQQMQPPCDRFTANKPPRAWGILELQSRKQRSAGGVFRYRSAVRSGDVFVLYVELEIVPYG